VVRIRSFLGELGSLRGSNSPHNPKVAGSNPAPATTEIKSLGQAQAFDYFGVVDGGRRPIEPPTLLGHGRAGNRGDVRPEEGITALDIAVQQVFQLGEIAGDGVRIDSQGRRPCCGPRELSDAPGWSAAAPRAR